MTHSEMHLRNAFWQNFIRQSTFIITNTWKQPKEKGVFELHLDHRLKKNILQARNFIWNVALQGKEALAKTFLSHL